MRKYSFAPGAGEPAGLCLGELFQCVTTETDTGSKHMKTGTSSLIVGALRALAERVRGLFVNTAETWKLIATERVSIAQVYQSYLLPLAALAAVLALLGWGLIELVSPDGLGMTVPMAVSSVLVLLVMVLVGIWMLAQAADALAPHFQARKSELRAFKLMAYSATPLVLVALFALMPGAVWLAVLALAGVLWLVWVGLPRLMRCPPPQRTPYFAVLASAIVLWAVVTVTLMSVMLQHGRPAARLASPASPALPSAADQARAGASIGASAGESASSATANPSASAELPASNAASGVVTQAPDGAAEPHSPEAAPDMAGATGAALPGAPLSSAALERLAAQIKALAPAAVAGLPREQLGTQPLSVGGATGVAVYGDYGQGDKSLSLNWVYVGANPKQTPMGEWANATLQRDDASRSERIYAEGARHISESARKDGSGASLKVLLANGLLLDLDAQNLPLDALKAALPSLKLSELEQLQIAP